MERVGALLEILRDDDISEDVVSAANEVMLNQKRLLGSILDDYKVPAKVVKALLSDRTNIFDIKLQDGIKLRKLLSLESDLAFRLGAVSASIAPAPNSTLIRLSVPNGLDRTVYLKSVLANCVNINNAKGSIPIAIGKTPDGEYITGDLSKMPHLLVAGATGAGKSVFLNSMILSILCSKTIDEVRFCMIDPKGVELTPYDGLRRLVAPVVVGVQEAIEMLHLIVDEMEERYVAMREIGVRNIDEYNERSAETDCGRKYKLVVIIDELADLILKPGGGEAVEAPIVLLAQKARAAGIHLVVSTQRPDKDVLTGLIKANFPARIAFAVTSGINSRIILDRNGAEKLFGGGDMLYATSGVMVPIRVQGCYISTEEVSKTIEFLREEDIPWRKAEQERIERERAEQERIAQKRAEQERIARERAEQERIVREKAEQERIARENAEWERTERERAEQKRIEREKAELERIAREKAELERIARERAEQERVAKERAELERIAWEIIEREKAEQERIAWEKAVRRGRELRERISREKIEQGIRERIEREKAEQERIEQERVAQERIEQERVAQEAIAREKAEQERIERERAKEDKQFGEDLEGFIRKIRSAPFLRSESEIASIFKTANNGRRWLYYVYKTEEDMKQREVWHKVAELNGW